MKEQVIFTCIFCISALSLAQSNEKNNEIQDEFAFCTEWISYDVSVWDNLHEYYFGEERIPGTKSIKAISRETGLWVTKHWVKDPVFLKKRAVVALDKEVMPIQNELINSINKWKKIVGVAYEEYNNRGMDIKPINKILALQAQLKKSKNWRKLFERDKRISSLAKEEIEKETNKLLNMIDKLFVPINAKIQAEYAAWAQQNPETAQQIAFKRKISELEKRVAAAESTALMATFEADKAKTEADVAEQRAIWAEAAANDAQRRADDAERRANDAQWRADDADFRLRANSFW